MHVLACCLTKNNEKKLLKIENLCQVQSNVYKKGNNAWLHLNPLSARSLGQEWLGERSKNGRGLFTNVTASLSADVPKFERSTLPSNRPNALRAGKGLSYVEKK